MPQKKFISVLLTTTFAVALVPGIALGEEIYNNGQQSFDMSGRADIIALAEKTADTEGESEIVDNGSRVNFTFQSHLSEHTTVAAVFEWGLNAVSNPTFIEFNGGSNSVSQGAGDHFLKNRYGYLEINDDRYGRVQVGKVRSVYMDVTDATDEMNVFSALASATYTYGDGGITGTGRSEQTARWDNGFMLGSGALNLRAQLQLRDDRVTVEDDDENPIGFILDSGGFGASASYSLDGLNVEVAVIRDDLSGRIEGVSVKDIRSIASAVSYSRGALYSAIVATTSDGMMQDEEGRPYDGEGYEFYTSYQLGNWKPAFGVNYTKSDATEFSILLTTFGISYSYPDSGFKLYAEGGVDSGVNSDGSDSERDYLSVGAQYKF